nr:uncharacterized protein LOC123770523 isoform X2 [Procambarus clarkii]
MIVSRVRLTAIVLVLVLTGAVNTCQGAASFTPATVEGRLLVPDTARVDNALLKTVQADKFLSLWFIYILSDAVHTSSEPWTLLVPVNSGLPKGGGFLVERQATAKMLLNHVVLGQVVDPNNPPREPVTTLAGTRLVFTSDDQGPMVNGVRLTSHVYKFSDGVVYVLENFLPVVSRGAPPVVARAVTTRLPPLTHRFATFKPNRVRPSGINTFRRTKPEAATDYTPGVQPDLADEFLLAGLQAGPESPESGSGAEGPEPGSGAEGPEPGSESEGPEPGSGAEGPEPGSGAEGPEFGSEPTDDSAASPGSEFSEFDGPTVQPPSEEGPFLESFLLALEADAAYTGSEFLHHFLDANITSRFRDTGRYTALVPYDSAFYGYYPIDWGFNPFLVENFTRELMTNHFIRGNIVLEDLPSLAELPTLGGRVIKFTKSAGKLLANGVEVVLESETQLSRGRSYAINDLLFINYDRVLELQAEHGDLETAPLLGNPWPTSQFLSHLLGHLQDETRTSFFAEYLNLTNLAYLLPGHDENLDPLKYTAFIPVDNAIAETLYADAPDPFLLDEILRENLVLNHLVRGRFYEKDLKDGLSLKNLANNTITISKRPDKSILVNNAQVVQSQTFIYNLGIVYLIDNVLVVDDQDIVKAINKFPDLHLGGVTEESNPAGSSNPLDENGSTILSRPAATTRPTTLQVTTSRPPTISSPTVSHTLSSVRTPTTSLPHAATTRFFNVPHKPTSTVQPATTTTSTPVPSPTTPRIRFATRTEISISRQVDDGVVEPIGNPAS